jgi:hypothetical protein
MAAWITADPGRLGFYRSSYDSSTVLQITVIIEETFENPWSVIPIPILTGSSTLSARSV